MMTNHPVYFCGKKCPGRSIPHEEKQCWRTRCNPCNQCNPCH